MIWTFGIYLVVGILAVSIYSIGVSVKFSKMANGDVEKYCDLIEEFLGMNTGKIFDEIKSDPLRFLFGIIIWPYRLAEAISAMADFCKNH